MSLCLLCLFWCFLGLLSFFCFEELCGLCAVEGEWLGCLVWSTWRGGRRAVCGGLCFGEGLGVFEGEMSGVMRKVGARLGKGLRAAFLGLFCRKLMCILMPFERILGLDSSLRMSR